MEREMKLLKGLSIAICTTLGLSVAQAGDLKPLPGQTAVRVCADAHNLPYSNDKLEGFDNKIADIIGDELGIPVEYYWFPQRIGFSRNTIKKVDTATGKFKCDLAMSIPSSSDFLATTEPYFSSIEAMVYRTDSGLKMQTLADIAEVNKTKPLNIGIFDRGLTTKPLLDLGLEDQLRYYQMMTGDARINAGRIVSEELASGKVDVVLLWGPIAAYYAGASDVDMTVVPLNELGEKHVFSFGLGIRYQDKAWKRLLNQVLEKRKDDIAAVIASYDLPSLENVSPYPKKRERKDDDD
jgi:quinoprotein dehydrogenase-associated probable ABC transporter substrate-binding protein